MVPHIQDEVQSLSLSDPEKFWSHQASQVHWHKPPSCAVKRTTRKLDNGIQHQSFTWFPDGEISTSYNCVDRHVNSGNGDATAIIWDSPVTGSKQRYTYRQLLDEVEVLAGVLREEGVRKGDVVLVYSVDGYEVSSDNKLRRIQCLWSPPPCLPSLPSPVLGPSTLLSSEGLRLHR